MDTNPELDAAVRCDGRVALDHLLLHGNGTAYSVNHARELNENAVAGVLHDPAVVFLGLRIDHFAEQRSEAPVRTLLVRTHQPRVAGHIGGKYRGETTFDGLF